MKATIVIILFGYFTITGCNDVTATKNIVLNDKGMLADKKLTHDSTSRNNLYKTTIEQDMVLGEIKFGMSKKQVDKIIQGFKKNGANGFGYYIGSYKYDEINGYYLEDSLYKLTIESTSRPTRPIEDRRVNHKLLEALREIGSGYTDADGQYHELAELLKNKYGEPCSNENPNVYNAKKMIWIIGKKTISLELNKFDKNSGHLYFEISLPVICKYVIDSENIKAEEESKRRTDSIANTVFK